MTTATSPNASPACRWIHELRLPCTKYPNGMTGIIEITSCTRRGKVTASYTVDPIIDGGRIVGWRLENLDNGQVYDIDHVSWGWSQAQCDCGQNVFRQKTCKHAISLLTLLQEIGVEK